MRKLLKTKIETNCVEHCEEHLSLRVSFNHFQLSFHTFMHLIGPNRLRNEGCLFGKVLFLLSFTATFIEKEKEKEEEEEVTIITITLLYHQVSILLIIINIPSQCIVCFTLV